jgi:hypothetical protein
MAAGCLAFNPLDPLGPEAMAPTANHTTVDFQAFGDFQIPQTLSGQQNNLRPQGTPSRSLAFLRPDLELSLFLASDFDLGCDAHENLKPEPGLKADGFSLRY